MTNEYHTVLYTGVTNNLARRVYEHKSHNNEGFTSRYKIHLLIYVEQTNDIREAIAREKQIKGWSRKKKIDLISTVNPNWNDLFLETTQ